MPSMRINVAKGGKAKVTVIGCTGPECQELTRGIESKLGRVISDTPTDEMYQEAPQGQEQET